MFTKDDCSYQAYRKILREIKSTGRYCDYKEVIESRPEAYIVLRHDIEFSVDRAYGLAQVETEENIQTSYFVQITNNAYNAFSDKNRIMLRKMHEMGHHIGLHYHRGELTDIEAVRKDVKRKADILSDILGISIDRYSFHRPLREHLRAEIKVQGLLNAYGPDFFVLTDQPDEEIAVKYIADSNHQWKYGLPTREYFERYPKMQLLIHPLSWSECGADHVNNFQMLVKEKHDEFVDTIEGEWKIFDQLRGKL